MRPDVWPSTSCRSSNDTPAARNRRPKVCRLFRARNNKHAYAQNRYEELTGWKASAAGGPTAKTLTPEQRDSDRQARLTVSRELGHEREQITAAYLGK
jgi:hypothetical protein